MITVLGEALLDFVQPRRGDLYRALPAGGPLNIAVALRRLGQPTALMARFSASALGDRVRRFAADAGLDLSAAVRTEDPATLAFATVDAAGVAAYDFYATETADWGWTADELDGLPPESRAVHTGSLAAAVEPGASRIAAWWERLGDSGRLVLSFDPNVRPALAGDRPSAVRRVEGFVRASHLVKASHEDLSWLYPDEKDTDVIRRWAGSGPALVVLTRGADGCVGYRRAGGAVEVAAPRVDVADTIGAGDAFHAGLLAALVEVGALDPTAVQSLDEPAVRRALEQASAVAALTCTRTGADPPTLAEVGQFTRR